jgi:uncharacterized membrane protein YqaE (UPF0057 family)
MCSADIFLGLLAILFPPLPVWVKRGICGVDSIINIALCMLGYIPGLLHSWYIIAKYPDPYEYGPVSDSEDGTTSYYYYISRRGHPPQRQSSQRGYGTTAQPQAAPQESGVEAPPKPQNQPPKPRNDTVADHADEGSSSTHPPPSYADVVKGDNKVQSQD